MIGLFCAIAVLVMGYLMDDSIKKSEGCGAASGYECAGINFDGETPQKSETFRETFPEEKGEMRRRKVRQNAGDIFR